MITVSGLSRAFGARALFDRAELRVGARDRVALVGPNGSGKTTLLEMIAGLQQADAGSIEITRGAVLGYLAQETDALRGRSVLEEVMSAGAPMQHAGHRMKVLEAELDDAVGADRADLLDEYARLTERFDSLGGWSLEAQCKQILAGLGFSDARMHGRTDALSGGWLMRVALAKLLVAGPDVLLLDEPTNHLDLDSVVWLEKFLRAYEGAVLLISHDRDFINGVAGRVVEIERAKLVSTTGDYEAFVRQREQRAIQAEASARNLGRRRDQLEVFVNRFRYKASKARQVQSKIKMLDKLERAPDAPVIARTMKLGFPPAPRSGRVVLTLREAGFSYGATRVYEGLELEVECGQKIALVGPNGAGKTTLLKLVAGALLPDTGEHILGHNAHIGYFAQHQIEALDGSNRVIDELQRAVPPGADVQARNLLGRFLFSGDDVDKPVRVLSGGERSRLALAKLLVSPFNLLCLDEPTNHLDIASRDVLEDALAEYDGAMLLITHDRHLIRTVVDRIVEVDAGRVRIFDGDYEDYLAKLDAEKQPSAQAKTGSAKDRKRAEAAERQARSRARNAVRKIEAALESAHAEMQALGSLLADPEFYARNEAVGDSVRQYEELQRTVKDLESEWDRLTADVSD